mmetsp:Transcript_29018/g.98792  ORF Transcript_29018/g.98792 Transcript_29018/m.98792 type:complete len:187 (-) Transcript_29018:45-605(-)
MSTRVHPIDPLDVAAAGRKSPAGSFGLFSAVSPPKKGDKSSSDEEEYAAYEAHQGRPRADSNASSTSSLIDEWWKKRGQRDADMRRGAAKSDAAARRGAKDSVASRTRSKVTAADDVLTREEVDDVVELKGDLDRLLAASPHWRRSLCKYLPAGLARFVPDEIDETHAVAFLAGAVVAALVLSKPK